MAKKKTVKEEVKEEPEIEESEVEEKEVVVEPKLEKTKKGYSASSSTPFIEVKEETPPPKKEKVTHHGV